MISNECILQQLLTSRNHPLSASKRALESCPDAQSIEQVMEWLIAHEDELNKMVIDAATSNATEPSASKDNGQEQASAAAEKKEETDGSEDCATKMAEKKKITVEEAQRIITERQAKRAEEERIKAIEDEKKRRLDGKKMKETIEELQTQERIRLAQQIRQEKLEKELHKKKVLEQIARDREAMRQRNQPQTVTATSTSTTTSTPSSSQVSATKSSSSECKIALRFPDGSNLMHKFSPSEQLAAVRLYVQMEKRVDCEMDFVAPPNKKFTSTHMHETLESLGLCPASRLEVSYRAPPPIIEAD